MLNEKLKLSPRLFKKDMQYASTRDGFGEGLVLAGQDPNLVVICADLTDSTRTTAFKQAYPDRFFQVGVAEQVSITIASGLANYGKIPFVTSYAAFSPGRTWEQIKVSVGINNVPVKIVGAHAGISAGVYGSTHHCLEDIALMRVLPNMSVVVPADALEARRATQAVAKTKGPCYLRIQKDETPIITSEDTAFTLGSAQTIWQSKNAKAAIIATGPILYPALVAARKLSKSGIGTIVINCHTIKPIDKQAIIHAAKLTAAIVVVEEHQVAAGLGSAVAEVLAKAYPVAIEQIGVQDAYGESGKTKELAVKFKLTSEDIASAVKRVIRRKLSDD